MKYNDLIGLIEFEKYNYDNYNIAKISNDIFNYHIKYDNPDVFSLLLFRLQQYPKYIIDEDYKKIFEKLYSLGSKINTEEEKEYVRKLVDLNFSSFFQNLEKSKDNLVIEFPFFAVSLPSYHNVKVSKDDVEIDIYDEERVEKYVDEIYNHVDKKIEEAGHYGSYKKLEQTLGPVLFEEIRYDVNPVLCDYIIDIYNRFINNSGNLKDKKLFLMICKVKNIEIMRVVNNLIILFEMYDVFYTYNEQLYRYINMKEYEKLYIFYTELLNKNKNFKKINENIDLLINREENYKTHDMEDVLFETLIHDLNAHHGLINEIESRELNIVLENNRIFENKCFYSDKNTNKKEKRIIKEMK